MTAMLIGIGAVVAAGLAASMINRPKVAFAFVVAGIALVPFWVQLPSIPIPPATWAILIALPAALKCRPRDTLVGADYLFAAVLVIGALAVAMQFSPSYAFTAMAVQWATAYVAARTLGYHVGRQFVADVLAFAGTALAVWAILEYLFHWHVFVDVTGLENLSFWADIQQRGGVDRSEASFGHAIALGGFLSMMIPFVMTSSFRWRLPMVAAVGAGTLATLSRGPILSALLTVILVIVFMPRLSSTTRIVTLFGGLLALLFVAPPLLNRFSQLSEELDPSSQYRVNLWEQVPADMNLIGNAQGVGIDAVGRSLYKGYGSIDSTPLLIGIDFGWIVVLLLASGLAVMGWRVMIAKGSAAEIALIGQIPTLLTVALITQYQSSVWLIVGLAVAFRNLPHVTTRPSIASRRRTHPNRTPDAPAPGRAHDSFRIPSASGW
ncbi:hypothetical protein [Williamsia sp. D3]|uniref:hypothetical protein n=1 Tax=Williamsia sp. D3 TaxID=1313067 RepID=UPI000410BED9|nr:hypothetical protein [Williamsia sp. D3]